MEKPNRILLVNTQFVEKYISGFTNRFVGLWSYLQKNPDQPAEVHWVTNQTLWLKFFGGQTKPKNVSIIKASLKWFRYTSRLLYPFYIVYLYYRKRCTSIHVATSIIDPLYLVRLFNLFNIPYCFTFASNGLDMGSYNSERMKRKWRKLFSLAKNIDVLNPTNSIENYRQNKFISPTSFPYITQLQHLPEHLPTNKERNNTIVFCGSFIAQKNPVLAIEGFEWYLKNIVDRPADVQLLLIGKGELSELVNEKISRINSTYSGSFVKVVPDTALISILSTSKIFLSLQDYDNYPSQSLMEAMLFCNSVISLNNGDTARLVHVDKNNILLPGKNPELLGKAINELLSNWQLNTKNKELIDKKFSVEVFARYFFDIHAKITNKVTDDAALIVSY